MSCWNKVIGHLEFPIWEPLHTESALVRPRHYAGHFFNGSPCLSTSTDLQQLTVPQNFRENGGTIPHTGYEELQKKNISQNLRNFYFLHSFAFTVTLEYNQMLLAVFFKSGKKC